jgi:hypothetical protein
VGPVAGAVRALIRMPAPQPGYAPGMAQDRRNDAHDGPPPVRDEKLDEQVARRAEPLPEEVVAGDVGDRSAEAAEILRDSEERVAEAAAGDAPGDAADEARRSEETV